MADRVVILLEDDWELGGNGAGNVADLQYLPSLFLMNLADEVGMKITFMAEVMQQIAMLENAPRDRNIRMQADLWRENVLLMIERGHDVQLHIHPQWYRAVLRDGHFRVGNNWNIATYDRDERRDMINSGAALLTELIAPARPAYGIVAFKAGSWALQPSRGILEDLSDAGIRAVIGIGRGIAFRSDGFVADYRGIEEDTLPYAPDFDDIRRVSHDQASLTVLPLPYYRSRWRDMLRNRWLLVTNALTDRLTRGQTGPRNLAALFHANPSRVSGYPPSPMQPVRDSGFRRLLSGGAARCLDISDGTFGSLKPALDQVMRRYLDVDGDEVPLVLQSHTKGYRNNLHSIRRFFTYLVDAYGSRIAFRTLSEYVRTASDHAGTTEAPEA